MNSSSGLTEAEPTEINTASLTSKAAPVACNRRTALWAGAAVAIVCSIMYPLLQHFPVRAALLRPHCWSWQLIPFSENWLWPYLSMFAIVGCAWLSLPDRSSTRRFAITFLGTGAIAWVWFFFWPTSCLRPAPETLSMSYRLLIFFDTPSNCLPCLHSGFTVLSACVLNGRISQMRQATLLRVALIVWVVSINLSILGLRQHTGIDVAAGLLLGGCAGWIYLGSSMRNKA